MSEGFALSLEVRSIIAADKQLAKDSGGGPNMRYDSSGSFLRTSQDWQGTSGLMGVARDIREDQLAASGRIETVSIT